MVCDDEATTQPRTAIPYDGVDCLLLDPASVVVDFHGVQCPYYGWKFVSVVCFNSETVVIWLVKCSVSNAFADTVDLGWQVHAHETLLMIRGKVYYRCKMSSLLVQNVRKSAFCFAAKCSPCKMAKIVNGRCKMFKVAKCLTLQNSHCKIPKGCLLVLLHRRAADIARASVVRPSVICP